MNQDTRIFIAYRSTGEDRKTLRHRMRVVVDALERAGYGTYCNAWEHERFSSSGMTRQQILDEGFAELDKSDAVLVLLASDDRSEGQLAEVGYAYAKAKPMVLAAQSDVATTLSALAGQTIRWRDLADLSAQLGQLRIDKL